MSRLSTTDETLDCPRAPARSPMNPGIPRPTSPGHWHVGSLPRPRGGAIRVEVREHGGRRAIVVVDEQASGRCYELKIGGKDAYRFAALVDRAAEVLEGEGER